MSEIEPPPDGLTDLFAAEKAARVVDPSAHSVMRARLAAVVGKTPLGHAVVGGVLGGAGKALAIIAITVAAGAGTVVAVRHGRTTQTAKPAVSLRTTAPVATTPPPTPPVAVSEIAPVVSSASHARVAIKAPEPSEPDLLARAWTVLSAGEPEEALRLADQDAQLHPDGVLVEERDAVQISALVKLHRMDEARSAASRFIRAYPTSVHRDLVERALQPEQESP
jgi:hypothetical protein